MPYTLLSDFRMDTGGEKDDCVSFLGMAVRIFLEIWAKLLFHQHVGVVRNGGS